MGRIQSSYTGLAGPLTWNLPCLTPSSLALLQPHRSACHSLSSSRKLPLLTLYALPCNRVSLGTHVAPSSLHSGLHSNVASSERHRIQNSSPTACFILPLLYFSPQFSPPKLYYVSVCFQAFSGEYKLPKGRDLGTVPCTYYVLNKRLLGR